MGKKRVQLNDGFVPLDDEDEFGEQKVKKRSGRRSGER